MLKDIQRSCIENFAGPLSLEQLEKTAFYKGFSGQKSRKRNQTRKKKNWYFKMTCDILIK